MKKVLLSIILLTFVFTPIANLIGYEELGTNHAYAAKKKLTQKTFNKQAASLSKQIKSYKSDETELLNQIKTNRMYNADNFAYLFEDETLGLSDDEVLAYYLQLVSKFADREDTLETFFEQDEIDIISDYMFDIKTINEKIVKLDSKIASYETEYKSLSKSKKYEDALKVRNDQIKAYKQLISVLETGVNKEYNLYYETQELFQDLKYADEDQNYQEDSNYEDTEDYGDTDDSDSNDDYYYDDPESDY